jgi:hypothetical protein
LLPPRKCYQLTCDIVRAEYVAVSMEEAPPSPEFVVEAGVARERVRYARLADIGGVELLPAVHGSPGSRGSPASAAGSAYAASPAVPEPEGSCGSQWEAHAADLGMPPGRCSSWRLEDDLLGGIDLDVSTFEQPCPL